MTRYTCLAKNVETTGVESKFRWPVLRASASKGADSDLSQGRVKQRLKNWHAQLPCLTLRIKGTVSRTSRQVYLLCRGKDTSPHSPKTNTNSKYNSFQAIKHKHKSIYLKFVNSAYFPFKINHCQFKLLSFSRINKFMNIFHCFRTKLPLNFYITQDVVYVRKPIW